jgi:hypothetical protein
MLNFRPLLAATSLFVLAACNGSGDKNLLNQADNSTFFIEKIDGSSSTQSTDPVFSLPTERAYNFKFCVKDILHLKPITNHQFSVSQINGSEVLLKSDDEGCLNWSESVSINYLAPSNNLVHTTSVSAKGLHKGTIKKEVVINPWSHGEDELSTVFDPQKRSFRPLVDLNSVLNQQNSSTASAPIWINEPRVTITEKDFSATGALMNLKFQSRIAILLKNTLGQNIQHQLIKGNFKIDALLYNQFTLNGVDHIVPLFKGSKSDVAFSQDFVVAEFPFQLEALPHRGQIMLALKVVPESRSVALEPFTAIFLVNDKPEIKVESRPTLHTGLSFDAISEKFTNDLNTKNSIGSLQLAKPGLEVDRLEVKFFKLGSETTTERQVFFNVKACIKNNLDKRPMRDIEFSISSSLGLNLTAKTNQDGCLLWDDSIKHKYFATERYFVNTVQISNSDFKLNEKIELAINPWDTGVNFARDNRFTEPGQSLDVNPSKEGPKIVFENYSFNVLNYKYKIDRFLNLKMVKTGVLSLNPHITNHSSLATGRMNSERLRDGTYLLRWAVVKTDEKEKLERVIGSEQQLVNSVNGEIKTEINFGLDAFATLNERNRLVISLYAVKESKTKKATSDLSQLIDTSSGLTPKPYAASIVLNNDFENQKMYPVDGAMGLSASEDLLVQIQRKFNSEQSGKISALGNFSPTQTILKNQGLALINLSQESQTLGLRTALTNPHEFYRQKWSEYKRFGQPQAPLTTQELSLFARTGRIDTELGKKLCIYWSADLYRRMNSNSEYGVLKPGAANQFTQLCLDSIREGNASKFFAVDKKLIIKEVADNQYLGGTTLSMAVGANFNMTKGENASVTRSWSWTTSAGLNFKFFDVASVGTNGSYSISKSISHNDLLNNSVQINSNTGLLVQTNTFKIQIKAYEECSSIKINPALFSGEKAPFRDIFATQLRGEDKAKAASFGYFICTGQVNRNPIERTEYYYLVSQDHWSSGQQQDTHDLRNRQLFINFRGSNDMSAFLGMIQGHLKMPNNHTDYSSSLVGTKDSLIRDFGSVIPTWPGVYSDQIK